MQIKDETWEIFEIYLSDAIDYFESIVDPDFEEATLKNQLLSILTYDISDEEE